MEEPQRYWGLTIAQVKHGIQQHEIICALQCAGIRRHTMRTVLKVVDGMYWDDGAVMNCIPHGTALG